MRRRAFTGTALLLGAAVASSTALAGSAWADAPVPTTPAAAAFSSSAPAAVATTPDAASASAAAAPGAGAAGAASVPAATTPPAAAAPGAAAAAIPGATAAALTPNVFSVVGRAKVARDGTITLTVKPQAGGKFIAFATTPAPIDSTAAAGASARPSPQPAPLPLPYGTAATVLPAGGQVPLIFHPGKAGREAVTRLRRPTTTTPLRITIAVSFVPTGGVLNTVVYVVKVYQAQVKLAAKVKTAAK